MFVLCFQFRVQKERKTIICPQEKTHTFTLRETAGNPERESINVVSENNPNTKAVLLLINLYEERNVI